MSEFAENIIPNEPAFARRGASGPTEDVVRKFETGATRDTDTGKFDYEAFLSPTVIKRYGQFMHKNRYQKDGTLRAGDNWQLGISQESYVKSLWRHFMDVWLHHRNLPEQTTEDMETSLCAVLFNASGYLHELLKEKRAK